MISMTTYGKLAGGTPDYFRLNVIVKTKAGYIVMSESKGADGKRKKLSKPYKTRGEAVRRMAQVDYFKAHKNESH